MPELTDLMILDYFITPSFRILIDLKMQTLKLVEKNCLKQIAIAYLNKTARISGQGPECSDYRLIHINCFLGPESTGKKL